MSEKTKIPSVNELNAEFESIIKEFQLKPKIAVALARAKKIGEQIGQLQFLTVNSSERIMVEPIHGNICRICKREQRRDLMTPTEFINNLKDTPNWNEDGYQRWKVDNPSTCSDIEHRSQYLESLGATVPSQEDLDDFVDEHSGPESPTDPIMELIIYQMYLKWMVWVKRCDYS